MRVAYHGRMPPRSRLRRPVPLLAVLACTVAALAQADPVAPVTSLSPDRRPTLIIVSAPAVLLIRHHPRPLSPLAVEAMTLKLGLQAARPVILRYERRGLDPLPPLWRSGRPDRAFASALAAALDRSQANWPWRDLEIVPSIAKARAAIAGLRGQDVVLVTFHCEIEDRIHTAQYSAEARVELLRDAGTARQSRTRFDIRHLSGALAADWGEPRRSAAVFRSGGRFDQAVDSAALDLSRALAVTVARLTTATPDIQIAGLEYGDLVRKPDCPVCRAGDTVLQQEPGRVWVAPRKLGGTILSLPLEAPASERVASEPATS